MSQFVLSQCPSQLQNSELRVHLLVARQCVSMLLHRSSKSRVSYYCSQQNGCHTQCFRSAASHHLHGVDIDLLLVIVGQSSQL